MKKATVEKTVIAFQILNQSKFGNMKDEEKFKAIKATRALKAIANDYYDFLRDTSERLKPEGIEEIQAKMQGEKLLTEEENAKLLKFNQDINACLFKELRREVELEFEPLEEESIDILVASADFKIGEVMVLYEILGK